MMRRDFLKTGVGGMGLALAGGVRAGRNPGCGQQSRQWRGCGSGIVIIGADGSVPSKPIVDK